MRKQLVPMVTPQSSGSLREDMRGGEALLLARPNVNPDKANRLGQPPLLLAALNRNEGISETLLERNDVNANTPDTMRH